MTREHKLALIIGFALVLLVGVAVSDHLSEARLSRLDPELALGEDDNASAPGDPLPAGESPIASGASPTPVRTIAAAPESSISAKPGPIAKGLSSSRSIGAIDWLGRFRDRLEDLPTAAQTTAATPGRQSQSPKSAPAENAPFQWRTVQPGDTLWSIAKERYGDGSLAAKLAKFNGLRPSDQDLIRVGVRLRIPPKHVLTGRRSARVSAQTPHVKSASVAVRSYTIKPGDTLSEIAMRELGTVHRLDEIIALNRRTLADPDVVPVGATIRLPKK